MKLFKALALTALLTTPAVADTVTDQEFCTSVSELSEAVMEGRQGGTPMSEMMRVAGSNGIMKSMVLEAFDHPRYSTRDVKRRTIQEFTNQWFSTCMKARS